MVYHVCAVNLRAARNGEKGARVMTTEENLELIRFLKSKEKELRAEAKGLISSTSDFVVQHAEMAKELAEFLEMFEKNKE